MSVEQPPAKNRRVMPYLNAYIQGDWVASPVSGSEDATIAKHYEDILALASDEGVTNVATWHQQAVGVLSEDVNKRTDVLRNCREVDQADIVITYLQRTDPPKKHWGSISIIAYATGKGKPSILLAPDDCIVWKHHFVHHPLVTRVTYMDHPQALLQLSNILHGDVPPAGSFC